MSWRLLLSDYPIAILNEISVAILALLEAGGLLTEDELREKVKVSPETFVKTLVALHADRLIEYSRNRVSVSDRGKSIVDKFSLHPDILDELVGKLELTPDFKRQLQLAISQYRDRSFDQYLNSVSAVRSWAALCRDDRLRRHLTTESEASGTLAIWIADLTGWAQMDPLTPELSFERLRLDLSTINSQVRNALILVNACVPLTEEENPWLAIREVPGEVTQLFCFYNESRRRLDRSFFLDEWSSSGELFGRFNSAVNLRGACHSLFRHAADHWVVPIQRELVDYERSSRRERALQRHLNDFVFNLLAAQNLAELAELTGVAQSGLRVLLEQVRDKCDVLIGPTIERRSERDAPMDDSKR